ncbi:MAG: hypothetical protein A2511_00665 [Deltaproteobacteria bacterium RIFOXYD12_FULL_50_9]|nr:MAG: hypothetical protein A2511_00665 [Deltaproteobacteria bacterium RIFOXYD12_FULL_50_9]
MEPKKTSADNKKAQHGLEISNIFDDLFPNDLLDASEIDNVYDELLKSPSERQGFAAVLEFLNKDLTDDVSGALLFHPTKNDITFKPAGESTERTLPLPDFRCIRTVGMPSEFPELDANCRIEAVETVDGKSYQVYLPALQTQENGLFALDTQEYAKHRYYFFPAGSIKTHYQKRYIGEILIEKGVISEVVLHRALEDHQQLKQKKLGRILSEQTQVKYILLENEIQKIYEESIKALKVGEILVESGLVNAEQVNRALATQSQNKKKRIGQYLVEKGLLKEEDVFKALAEKFRLTYVDLQQAPISKKAIELLPMEIILKLQVLPISLKHDTLVVATMVPDVPAIKEIILKYTKQQNIQLVLARPSQLRIAIKQLFPQTAAGQ